MDHKRELTSVDLAALEGELAGYEGAKLDKAYLYPEDDLVRLKLRDFDRGRVEFLIEVGDVKRAHAADQSHVPDAPGRPPDFAMMLRNRLSGADLVRVEQFEFDRIIELEFDREDASTTIVAELFGDGNVAVLDEYGEVIDCLETVRLKSRTVAPGTPYEFPSARFNPMTVDYDGFVARIKESDADLVRTLATQLNFGGLYGEELCTRAGIDYNVAVDDLDESDFERLYELIDEMGTRLREGDVDPRVYYETLDDGDGAGNGESGDDPDRRRIDVTPIPLAEYEELYSESFTEFNPALDDYFFNFQREEEVEGGETQRPDFEAEIEKQQRIIQQQEQAIEDFEADAEVEREKAELLYANYDLVDDVLSTVQAARQDDVSWDDIEAKFDEGADRGIAAAEAVVSLDGSEGTVTLDIDGTRVTVDAFTGVEKNADELYKEAKRIEEKKEGALAAIENTREDLEAVKERREEWEADDGEDEADNDEAEDEPTDWLSMQSIPTRSTERWYEQFRWFHTSDGFLVIGGRDADDNEELVQKYLEGGDKFFHAQAHGGPVTVLKATGPSEPSKEVEFPQSSLDQAAQFAVSYSSVWKDGKFAGDVYMVDPDQVSKTPESGEYLEKGGFAVRGDRTYFEGTPAGVAVGITCDDETRVIGGPPAAIEGQAATSITVEPGQYAQNDIAKRLYREFKERFADETFVRKVASPDQIQEFLPPGGSRMTEE
ncbi:fibronectin-binding protein [Haloarcula hispanica N601]|uniref:Archaeal Rqc2 homolog aRqcH n=2 Tax=Haloarcula hispanica TaxID=51589 RepID=V5TN52_HALHI|nr:MULTISPECIES: ribosome rescue protein RqcH [Haloarcula]AEM57205.1 fibronectin-binding A domain protein [Haloarcula hispanica ATCC 33960]AHB65989.1 fibronectin-binding protein [Haloarcula hispanica N601]AJF27126.1 fibronectin-binding protein [Haloarcula sp. CBA1115]